MYSPASQSEASPLTARVGLVFIILAAVIFITLIATFVILRIHRGPNTSWGTFFTRQPIPKRRHVSPDPESCQKDRHKNIISPVPTARLPRSPLHKELHIETRPIPATSTRSSLPPKPIRNMSEAPKKNEKLQIQPLRPNRRRASTRSSGAIPCRLYPPSEFSVPDSPVIVLPSPSDLQKFRINVR
ncbi:uncharacterized protein BO80DRAFT_199075 [Aspergillus ibericus CBS 121593]|uniref:Uncharacterized protein n=1 Tax=Aspergillus ibericus CBS 121593 TaxID=1448316 RepID=A0A395GNS0_9EURO|nr:hypothetical protein BO80DRAFT_199075 [Aspergillus ibericus CBS 121593]RAK97150.1 hypothetical protein BO80DRAFT_199075 [Aspergillus ibericus CBS 121593]